MRISIFILALFVYSDALIERFFREADERNVLDDLLSDCAHRKQVK